MRETRFLQLALDKKFAQAYNANWDCVLIQWDRKSPMYITTMNLTASSGMITQIMRFLTVLPSRQAQFSSALKGP